MQKFIVIYFSHQGEVYNKDHFEVLKEGFTAHLAKEISSLLKSDLYEIRMVHPYPVSYKECLTLGQEDLQKNNPVELEKTKLDLKAFDGIILGYPIWFSSFPQPVKVFLNEHKDVIKDIYPFITSGGGTPAYSLDDLAFSCPKAHIHPALSLVGSSLDKDDEQIKNWLIKNNLIN